MHELHQAFDADAAGGGEFDEGVTAARGEAVEEFVAGLLELPPDIAPCIDHLLPFGFELLGELLLPAHAPNGQAVFDFLSVIGRARIKVQADAQLPFVLGNHRTPARALVLNQLDRQLPIDIQQFTGSVLALRF